MREDEPVYTPSCGDQHHYMTMRLMNAETVQYRRVQEPESHCRASQCVVQRFLHQLQHITLDTPGKN